MSILYKLGKFSVRQDEENGEKLVVVLRESTDSINNVKKIDIYFAVTQKRIIFAMLNKKQQEDWQSDRMRWTRNPVYPFLGIGGLNPSSSAKNDGNLSLIHKNDKLSH